MITVILKPGLTRHLPTGSEDPSQFLGRINYRLNTKPQSWRPPTDIYEMEDRIIVLVEIAGMREEDVSIIVDRSTLSINGFRPSPLPEIKTIHQLEIPFGDFTTDLEYTINIDTNNISATYQNGFLRIELLKSKPKPIQINKD